VRGCHLRPVSGERRQIVAFGGGGFAMERGNTLLDDYLLGAHGQPAAEGLLPPARERRRRPQHRPLLPRVRGELLRALARLAVPAPLRGRGRPPDFIVATRDDVTILMALCAETERIVPNWRIVSNELASFTRQPRVNSALSPGLGRLLPWMTGRSAAASGSRLRRAGRWRPPRQFNHRITRTGALLDWSSIESPGLSRSYRRNRLIMRFIMRRERCAARRSGQRPGQRASGGPLSQPPAKRQKPRHSRDSPSGASRTRTGDLLGAIRRPWRLSSACLQEFCDGRRGAAAPRVERNLRDFSGVSSRERTHVMKVGTRRDRFWVAQRGPRGRQRSAGCAERSGLENRFGPLGPTSVRIPPPPPPRYRRSATMRIRLFSASAI
jgi:hypothetical protein